MPTNTRAGSRWTSEGQTAESLLREMIRLPADDPRRGRIRTRLVELHMPVARRIARQYAQGSEPLEDIQQSALLGLVKAINRYDPDLGHEFFAYAFPMMAGEVKRHFRDRTWPLHVPRRTQELRLVHRRATSDFTQAHGRAPKIAEIAAFMDISEEEAVEVIGAVEAYRPTSLDTPTAGEDTEPRGHGIGAEDPELDLVVDRQALWPLIDELPARERQILILRFFGNQTQSEIAEKVGLSQMHVSRLITRSLDWLRTELLRTRPTRPG
jgi:RNA polymerase sigma-B factor